jgi:AraC-like DNA-binding protein
MNEQFSVVRDGPAKELFDCGEAALGGERRRAGDSADHKMAAVPACRRSPQGLRKAGIKKHDGQPRSILTATGREPRLTKAFQAGPGVKAGPFRMKKSMVRVFEKLSTKDVLNGTVAELEVKFHCSLGRLNCIFRQYFGLSIVALRMEIRLCRARTLLLEKGAKVREVMQEAGFNHEGLFAACFKKRFGLSPREWQKTGGAAPKDRSRHGTEFRGSPPLA